MPDSPSSPRKPQQRSAAGESNPTIKDLAVSLGVSHSTVSRALNDHPHISDEVKERVRQKAAELGYVANESARALRQASSRLIGLIVPNVISEFSATLVKIVAARCYLADYQIILCVTEEDSRAELRHVEMLRRSRASGIVIVPTQHLSKETAALLANMPLVQFSRTHSRLHAPGVTIDGAAAMFSAVNHLADLGHTRIAYIGLSSGLSTGDARAHGFRETIKARGLEFESDYFHTGAGTSNFAKAKLIAMLNLRAPPSAVIFGTADHTLGGLEAIRQASISVPHQLSVIGYGDPPWLRIFEPAISTIGLSLIESAEASISMLLRRIEAIGEPENQLEEHSTSIDPYLILRRSTAAPASR